MERKGSNRYCLKSRHPPEYIGGYAWRKLGGPAASNTLTTMRDSACLHLEEWSSTRRELGLEDSKRKPLEVPNH